MGRKKVKKIKSTKELIITLIIFLIISVGTYVIENINKEAEEENNTVSVMQNTTKINIQEIPDYTDQIYIEINNNKPYFTEEDYTTESFEKYSELDSLGRCGVAYANICKETMPPKGDTRGDISSVKPTGWKQTKYKGEYLYNRCHLIAYSLSDEDDNKLNLITGTRYFNVNGMLVFEKQVLEYMNKNKNNHVLYRVTPIFKGNNLLATGVEMEAYSVEDNGKGICFNVFVYNIQPEVNLNYETGEVIK